MTEMCGGGDLDGNVYEYFILFVRSKGRIFIEINL